MYSIFKQLCDNKKIKPAQLSKDIGIPQATLSFWKNGTRHPSLNTMKKIANYFDVSVDYLSGETVYYKKCISSAELDADIISDKEFMNLVYQLYMLDISRLFILKS